MFQEKSSDSRQSSRLSEWFWIVLTFLLFLFSLNAAWDALRYFGPVWGLLAPVAAIFLWTRLGPRPWGVLLPSWLALWVLASNVFCVLLSVGVLLKHFAHHTV